MSPYAINSPYAHLFIRVPDTNAANYKCIVVDPNEPEPGIICGNRPTELYVPDLQQSYCATCQ